MALTKVQTIGIETGISLTGVTTVTTLNASTDTLSVGGTVNFGGNVSIAGTLTYEDVTNIDSVGIITARAGIEIPDSQKITFGDSDDLQIYHDGSKSYIQDTGTGSLRVISNDLRFYNAANNEYMARFEENGAATLYYDANAKIVTTSDGITVTGRVTCDEIRTGDDDKIQLGNSQDFRIYHDGSTNIIDGHYHPIELRHQSEVHAKFVDDGAVELYHNNSKKFETTSTGVTITGTATATEGLVLDGQTGSGKGLRLDLAGSGDYIIQETTTDDVVQFGGTGASNFFVHNISSGRIGIGTASPSSLLHGLASSGGAGITLESSATSGEASLALKGKNSSGTVRTATIKYDNSDKYRIAVVSNIGLGFETNDTERMRLNSHGGLNVGSGVLTAGSQAGNIVVDEGIYISAYNGDNQIRGNSAGSGSATLYIGNSAIQVSSDRRIKENIVDTVVDAAEELKRVRVVDFTWNDPSDTSFNNRNARGTWTGVIAQELVDVFPFAVNAPRTEENLSIDHDSEKRWLVNQDQLVPVLIKAFQQALAKIETLETKVAALEG